MAASESATRVPLSEWRRARAGSFVPSGSIPRLSSKIAGIPITTKPAIAPITERTLLSYPEPPTKKTTARGSGGRPGVESGDKRYDHTWSPSGVETFVPCAAIRTEPPAQADKHTRRRVEMSLVTVALAGEARMPLIG